MGISIWQLLIVLAIVILLFGAKRLRTLGGDLGTSIKGFRQAMKEGETDQDNQTVDKKADSSSQGRVIEGEVSPHETANPNLKKENRHV
jgi:sec-independent protein translocase protein TatA